MAYIRPPSAAPPGLLRAQPAPTSLNEALRSPRGSPNCFQPAIKPIGLLQSHALLIQYSPLPTQGQKGLRILIGESALTEHLLVGGAGHVLNLQSPAILGLQTQPCRVINHSSLGRSHVIQNLTGHISLHFVAACLVLGLFPITGLANWDPLSAQSSWHCPRHHLKEGASGRAAMPRFPCTSAGGTLGL